VQACASAEEALALLRADYPGVVVTDVRLPGRSGLELLAQVAALDAEPAGDRRHRPRRRGRWRSRRCAAAPMTSSKSRSPAGAAGSRAPRAGAAPAGIGKPRAARRAGAASRHARPGGRSAAIEQLKVMVRNVAPAGVDVLINGQTGTGKEVVARLLHAASGRKGNFVAINCGALPESVFESEIFGHEAGAFTGAQKRRIGKLEYAQGGTVFLDEIESMPMALQVKLLRVLQERRLERLGGNDAVALECTIVAATKVDLLQLSAQGQFREDLYYRIGVVSIDLPRLRDRRDDIPLLLAHFRRRWALPVP
jgi:two-component system C4-dicarboxylate transport response regulator DctD